MRSIDIKTWLTRGTYPRLFLPILALILVVSALRYDYLLGSETAEANAMMAGQLQQTGLRLLPLLAVSGTPLDASTVRALLHAELQGNPALAILRWRASGGEALEVANPPLALADVPAWFTRWVVITQQQKQFLHMMPDGTEARLTVVIGPQAGLLQVWRTVGVQLRISALNIFAILFLLTLLLRANARMLTRLRHATDAFKAGQLDMRMDVVGTLEAREVARTFNAMALQVQTSVESLRATQRQQGEQLHFTRQLIDALPLPIFVRSAQGVCLAVNRAWEQLFDTPAAKAVGAAMSSDYAALPHEQAGRERRARPPSENEILVKAAGSQLREMVYFKAPFTSVDGAQAGTIGALVDITERKLAQEALVAEMERAVVTLASIGDGVITTDPGGHIESINEVAQFLTGYTLAQARGRTLAEVFNVSAQLGRQSGGAAVASALAAGSAVHVNDQVLIHRSGERYAIEYTAAPIRSGHGIANGCVLVFRDVTETRDLMQKISWQARHDALTGLDNRVALAERFTHALFRARHEKSALAVCLLDLDSFQSINERYGEWAGDRLLKEVALRLSAAVAEGDVVARLGGDEFVVLLCDASDGAAIAPRVARLLRHLAEPYAIDDVVIQTTASIGVTVFPLDDANPDTLLRHADQAMCQAKHTGRNRIHFFDAQLDQEVQTNYSRRTRVAKALEDGELRVFYQPKVNLRSGRVLGMEALIRWQHPEQGLLGPGHFLGVIEDTDVIVDLGEWVLHQSLSQMAHWVAQGCDWTVSVNIAARHFHRSDFVSRLKDVLAAYPSVSPGLLELEILESAALEDVQHMCEVMRGCQALGVRFALDDFGTGFSSLSYLKRLPAETIKIDQIFVRGLLEDHDDLTLVTAIVALAKAFQRHVIAEGVETVAQGRRLLELGCELAQGFGIARPMPAGEVQAWVSGYDTHGHQAFTDPASIAPTATVNSLA